jgi:hypothetical protein
MDVHVPRAITDGLRLRRVDVVTAQQDEARGLGDAELLDRAGAQGRALFTRDTLKFDAWSPQRQSMRNNCAP